MEHTIDPPLVRQATKGDPRAIQQILSAVQDLAWKIARDFSGDWDQAQDLAQEILIEIDRSLPALRDAEHFIPWCFTLGKRVCSHWARRRQRRDHIWAGFHLSEDHPDPAVAAAPFRHPEAVLLEDERRREIRRSLAKLGTQTQQTMRLFYLEGLSLDQIARRLNISANTVKQRLHAGRRRLKEELEYMPATAEERQRPAVSPLLRFTYSGSWTGGAEGITTLLQPLLVQQILAAIAQIPKSTQELAQTIGVDPIYIEDHIALLRSNELVRTTPNDLHRADFIILDQATQDTLTVRVEKLGREAAQIIAGRLPSLKAAFAQTTLATQGFDWNYMRWLILPAWVANCGIRLVAPDIFHLDLPLRPDGNRWLYLAYPTTKTELKWQSWCTRINPNDECSFGSFGTPALGYETSPIPNGLDEKRQLLRTLASGPQRVDALTPEEETQTQLAELVEGGYCRRDGDTVHLSLPLLTPSDDRTLFAVVEEICHDIVKNIYKPGLEGINSLLDQAGYAHLKTQYPMLSQLCSSDLADHCFEAMVDMGLLGETPTQRHTAWGCWMWKGDVQMGKF